MVWASTVLDDGEGDGDMGGRTWCRANARREIRERWAIANVEVLVTGDWWREDGQVNAVQWKRYGIWVLYRFHCSLPQWERPPAAFWRGWGKRMVRV